MVNSTLVIESPWLTSGFPAQIEGSPQGDPFAIWAIAMVKCVHYSEFRFGYSI